MANEPGVERYFSVRRWPLRILWNYYLASVRHPLARVLLFPLIVGSFAFELLRRFFRLITGTRADPVFGIRFDVREPATLKQFPLHVRKNLENHLEEAEACGFSPCLCFRALTIGNAESYEVYLLDDAGERILLLYWFSPLDQRDSRNSQDVTLYCSSVSEFGARHVSTTDERGYFIAEMRLPDEQVCFDPEIKSIEDLVRFHRERLSPGTQFQTFDRHSLERRLQELTVLQVQSLLDKDVYFELTPHEIEKLKEKDAGRERRA